MVNEEKDFSVDEDNVGAIHELPSFLCGCPKAKKNFSQRRKARKKYKGPASEFVPSVLIVPNVVGVCKKKQIPKK